MIHKFIGGFFYFMVFAVLSPIIAIGFASVIIYEAFGFGVTIAELIMTAIKELK